MHGVEGWVRNRRDGSVEAVFAGASEPVRAVIEACRRGPRGARVEALDENKGSDKMLAQRRPGERFSVLRTE
jgi:acylphosphatase